MISPTSLRQPLLNCRSVVVPVSKETSARHPRLETNYPIPTIRTTRCCGQSSPETQYSMLLPSLTLPVHQKNVNVLRSVGMSTAREDFKPRGVVCNFLLKLATPLAILRRLACLGETLTHRDRSRQQPPSEKLPQSQYFQASG
jgi:hypothetical protein